MDIDAGKRQCGGTKPMSEFKRAEVGSCGREVVPVAGLYPEKGAFPP